jgi:hypothetical protein
MKTIIKILIFLVILLIFLQIKVAVASAPERGIEEYSTTELISYFAEKYKVSEHQMLVTGKCESSFDKIAVGDKGKSFGLWQIHLPAHPDITKEQAFDPVFSTEWTAQEFSKGHQKQWTCWRDNFGVK